MREYIPFIRGASCSKELNFIWLSPLDENKDGELQPDEFVNLMHVAGIGGSHADVGDAKKFYMELGLPLRGQKVFFIFFCLFLPMKDISRPSYGNYLLPIPMADVLCPLKVLTLTASQISCSL